MIKKLLLAVVGLAVLVLAFGAFKTSQKPKDLWLSTGKLAACAEDSSGCISSMSTDEAHQVSPLGYPGSDLVLVNDNLKKAVAAIPGAQIQTATPEYLHVVVRGPMMMRDDVEFLIEPAVVQMRSISRLGFGDNAAHRARIEKLRESFQAQFATAG